MPPRVVLVGPMGAGKTSVGRRVARALDLPSRIVAGFLPRYREYE